MKIEINKHREGDKVAVSLTVNDVSVKDSGVTHHEVLGLLEMAKFDLLHKMKGNN